MTQQPIESTDKPKARKPLWRRLLKWTFRVIVALLAIKAVTWAIFDYTSAKALEDQGNRM